MHVKACAQQRCDAGSAALPTHTAMPSPLDLRHLPPPLPMERILDALDMLAPGMRLAALTPHRPGPLLPLLEQRGFTWRIDERDDGSACITIWRIGDAATLPPDPRHGAA